MNRNYSVLYFFGILVCFVAHAVATKAIIGGSRAEAHRFLYQVSLETRREGHICGGGIIGDQFILTAAHCVSDDDGRLLIKNLQIHAGMHVTDDIDEFFVTGVVEKIYMPAEFKPPFHTATGDIAVLKLAYPLGLAEHKHLKQLKLPKNEHDTYIGQTVEIAGSGMNWMKVKDNKEIGGNNDSYLYYAKADVLDYDDCKKGYRDKDISDKQFCARVQQHPHFKSLHGVCDGDSGGPLVLDQKIAIGILSLGPFGCSERKQAGIYTRVAQYLTFIEHVMQDRASADIRTQVIRKSD